MLTKLWCNSLSTTFHLFSFGGGKQSKCLGVYKRINFSYKNINSIYFDLKGDNIRNSYLIYDLIISPDLAVGTEQ